MAETAPRLHLLAGLNGAGKTTYARELQASMGAGGASSSETSENAQAWYDAAV